MITDRRSRAFHPTTRVLWVLAMAAVGFAPGFFLPLAHSRETGLEDLRKTGKAFSAVAKRVSPAVVFVQVEKVLESGQGPDDATPFNDPFDLFNDEFFKRFFGDRLPRRPPQGQYRITGQGSGFIVSANGYILTNNHVVGGADKVTVKLLDGREFQAKTVGTDAHTDVAVVKIDADHLPVLPLGNSDDLEVGEWVLAIGNPFGLSHTLTAGIVSAKGRSAVGIADYEDFIQTDAAINPGNSGGPLVNLAGQAVGINTAIFSRSGGYMGIGFAIPINMAKTVRDQLIKSGSVTRGYLGIFIQPLTPDLARTFGVQGVNGVLVADVANGSPAEKAGLQQGDVLLELDGRAVGEVGQFRNRIALMAPNSKIRLKVLRKGKEESLTVTIGKLANADQVARGDSRLLEKIGVRVETLTKDLAERLGCQETAGVVVTQVSAGSLAALAGLKPGTVILEVNRKAVHDVDEFGKALEESQGAGTLLMLVKNGRYPRYVALRLGK